MKRRFRGVFWKLWSCNVTWLRSFPWDGWLKSWNSAEWMPRLLLDHNNARLPYTKEMLEADRRNFAGNLPAPGAASLSPTAARFTISSFGEAIEVLPKLYGLLVIPSAVVRELTHGEYPNRG